jgi:hypothetical protein
MFGGITALFFLLGSLAAHAGMEREAMGCGYPFLSSIRWFARYTIAASQEIFQRYRHAAADSGCPPKNYRLATAQPRGGPSTCESCLAKCACIVSGLRPASLMPRMRSMAPGVVTTSRVAGSEDGFLKAWTVPLGTNTREPVGTSAVSPSIHTSICPLKT